jgi:hypothetical protein
MLTNHKWQDSLKFKGSYSFLSLGIANFGFLTFHQNLSNSYLRQGLYKNGYKGQRKKVERKWKCRNEFMDKNLVAPVSVGSKRIRPITHPTQSPFILIHAPHDPKQ